jgi:Phage integrase family
MPAFMADLRARPALAAVALELAVLTATRTNEILKAQWKEFDLVAGVWTIPEERMKARREHRVALSKRALAIVNELWTSRSSNFVFCGQTAGKPLSSTAMLRLLERMGRRGAITSHGFRSSFSDWASEVSRYSSELRETALAHTIGNKAEAAYRRGDALEKRRCNDGSLGAMVRAESRERGGFRQASRDCLTKKSSASSFPGALPVGLGSDVGLVCCETAFVGPYFRGLDKRRPSGKSTYSGVAACARAMSRRLHPDPAGFCEQFLTRRPSCADIRERVGWSIRRVRQNQRRRQSCATTHSECRPAFPRPPSRSS